jgi:hypothetical protein
LCLNDVDDKELLTLYSYYAAKYKKIEFANPDGSQIFELGISISISTERIYQMYVESILLWIGSEPQCV